ncbi:unnamed protein product [Toxocara canis]|uniref:Uncharacterized protein n=1 Tax=Toxocara canis TaxID=6265 RepID=A0A183V4A4_TOXCA|nr:unnamed protein product [Toxocara canis]
MSTTANLVDEHCLLKAVMRQVTPLPAIKRLESLDNISVNKHEPLLMAVFSYRFAIIVVLLLQLMTVSAGISRTPNHSMFRFKRQFGWGYGWGNGWGGGGYESIGNGWGNNNGGIDYTNVYNTDIIL